MEFKFSSKIEKCTLSPMRKFHDYEVKALEKGRNIYHLNIGQPDVETPRLSLMVWRISLKMFSNMLIVLV
ncbi:hypothetical protein RFF05_15265 [Bengtsoniella intestinalis]|uniref:hypothetical protein n=1 Tax=Bengtsoniella intestinalis TaxID=3073143 RepID=UPI00391FB21C